MRIAAISDIHGNLLALNAVLADIASRSVDVVVNLGDLLSGGNEPAETADRLMDLDLPTVRGNHDRQVLESPPETIGSSDRSAREQITQTHRGWLSRLPPTLSLTAGVLAFHGTPFDDATYLTETAAEAGARPATPDEIAQRLGSYASLDLLLCGHTHLPRMVLLPTGALVVNPGSVGYPAYAADRPFRM